MTEHENPFGKLTTTKQIAAHFQDGMTLMVGGFGGVGSPPSLLQAMLDAGTKHIHLISNDTGFPDIGVGRLVRHGRIASLITSHIGSNPYAGQLMTEGKLQVEFSPQGTLAERIRAGGAGLAGIVIDVGLRSMTAAPQYVKMQARSYVIEPALTADVSLIYAKQADPFGNLTFDKSARNMNPLMAMAGRLTIVEAAELVPLGALSPEEIVVPGVFVHHIVQSEGVNWTWAWE